MKKKIAILTRKGELSKGILPDTVFNVFALENDKVIEVEQETIKNLTSNYISLWLSSKNVNEVYIEEMNPELKNKINNSGILVKFKEELKENSFFNQFIFD